MQCQLDEITIIFCCFKVTYIEKINISSMSLRIRLSDQLSLQRHLVYFSLRDTEKKSS